MRGVLAGYRKYNPEDMHTDEELVITLLDWLCECGHVTKLSDGVYLLPGTPGLLPIPSSIPDDLPYGRGVSDLLCLN